MQRPRAVRTGGCRAAKFWVPGVMLGEQRMGGLCGAGQGALCRVGPSPSHSVYRREGLLLLQTHLVFIDWGSKRRRDLPKVT